MCVCYYGDIITVGVSLLTVYEVSTLELWSFQSYTVLYSGHAVYVYYTSIIFLLVIIIQQSIFLVVIIESFADIRNDSNFIIRSKPQPRPDFVSGTHNKYTSLYVCMYVYVCVCVCMYVLYVCMYVCVCMWVCVCMCVCVCYVPSLVVADR